MTDSQKYKELLAEHDGDEARVKWEFIRWKGREDLYFFGSVLCGLENAVDVKTGRHRLDEKIHKIMAQEFQKNEDTLQLWPRSHMKSTWLKLWIIWQIVRNPNVRIGFWSKTAALVRKELANIKYYCTLPELAKIYPEIFTEDKATWEKDTRDEFTMKRDRTKGQPPQEAQVEVWGVTATVTGHHYDFMAYDDPLDQDTCRTAMQMEKLEDWWSYMQAIKDLGAVEKMIGTRYHMRDLYGKIMQEGYFKKENITIRKCRENGRPIYKFFTNKDLDDLERKMGEEIFSAQMNNEPTAKSGKIFLAPYPLYTPDEFPKAPKYYIAVDPASTATRYSDHSGICVAAVDSLSPNRAFFVKGIKVKLTPDKLAELIVDLIAEYRPRRVGIELGNQQALQILIDIQLREKENQLKTAIRPIFVPLSMKMGTANKADKLNMTIGAMMRANRALFPGEKVQGKLVEKLEFRPMFREFDLYNPRSDKNEDDIIDAAGMIIQTVEHFAQSHWYGVKDDDENLLTFTTEYILKRFGQSRKREWDKVMSI